MTTHAADLWLEEQPLPEDLHAGCTGPDHCCPECLAAYHADMDMLAQAEAEAEVADLPF
jgi:hypothetical protein